MSLDKDRILNDLENVMSQLQSADCGCMGKLFSNPSLAPPGMGMVHPLPTCGGCRRGCCRGHGHSMAPHTVCNYPGMCQSGMSQPVMASPYMDHTGTYETGMDQTGMRQPTMGQRGMGQPGMGQPGMGQPGMGHPGMGQPGMDQPGMGQPGMDQPSMGQPGMGKLGIPMNREMNPAMDYMGGAHAPKLYADTYNYLSKNLMNPVVQEVYEDLKSITPENTMTNSPLGTQMGLKPGMTCAGMTKPAQNGGNAGMPPKGHGGMNIASLGQEGSMNQMGRNPQQMGKGPMGMGPQIAKTMMGDRKSNKLSNPMPLNDSYRQQQGSTPSGAMANPGSMSMGQENPGSMGMGQANPGAMGMGQENPVKLGVGQENPGSMGLGQGNPPTMGMGQVNPARNNMGQGNSGSQMQDQNNKQQNAMNTNSAMQQMTMGNRDYGEHTEGMKKFNEMFPGVTGVDGDLGFDPMAIAFKMNPANHKQSAMNSMNEMLMGDRKKWMSAANNQLQASFSQGNQQNQPMTQQQHQLPDQTQMNGQGQQQMLQQQTPQVQLQSAPPIQQQGTPALQQQQVDPNTGAPTNPTTLYTNQQFGRQGYGTNAQMQRQPTQGQPGQAMYKEHLLPADPSQNMAPPPSRLNQMQYQYNTLGQAVEMLPAQMYRMIQETGPQTLSPQPVPLKRNIPANVKNTESKTSIMDIMGGRGTISNPGKTQLQQIYNQYKKCQSYTQNNLTTHQEKRSLSEGHLNQIQNQRNARQPSPIRQANVEQVGGDTFANNNMPGSKVEQVMVTEQIGDVPVETLGETLVEALVETPDDDTATPMEKMFQMPVRKTRNGLQDQVYTSGPITNAWSFHGNRAYRPAPHLYRSNRAVKWCA